MVVKRYQVPMDHPEFFNVFSAPINSELLDIQFEEGKVWANMKVSTEEPKVKFKLEIKALGQDLLELNPVESRQFINSFKGARNTFFAFRILNPVFENFEYPLGTTLP